MVIIDKFSAELLSAKTKALLKEYKDNHGRRQNNLNVYVLLDPKAFQYKAKNRSINKDDNAVVILDLPGRITVRISEALPTGRDMHHPPAVDTESFVCLDYLSFGIKTGQYCERYNQAPTYWIFDEESHCKKSPFIIVLLPNFLARVFYFPIIMNKKLYHCILVESVFVYVMSL